MYVQLQRGSIVLDLAGGDGQRSETTNFRIGSQPGFQQVQYIEADQFDQFFRGGSSTTVSFDSVLTFATLVEAEAYMMVTPQGLLTQAGQTVIIGKPRTGSNTSTQQEKLTCVGTTTAAGVIDISFTAADVGTIATTATVGISEAPSTYAPKILTAINRFPAILARYSVSVSGAEITITKRNRQANDTTLSLAITNNATSSPGITPATSVLTRNGAAFLFDTSITLSSVSCVLNLAQNGVSVLQNVTLVGKY
jgi:hypothetical protein